MSAPIVKWFAHNFVGIAWCAAEVKKHGDGWKVLRVVESYNPKEVGQNYSTGTGHHTNVRGDKAYDSLNEALDGVIFDDEAALTTMRERLASAEQQHAKLVAKVNGVRR